MRESAIAACLAILLASCTTPEPYRFRSDLSEDAGLLLQPETRVRQRDGEMELSIDIPDVLMAPKACGAALNGPLTWRSVPAWRDGRSGRALRIEGPLAVFRASDFETTLKKWWPQSGLDQSGCLRPGGADAVYRAVIGQRPLSPEEAVAWWFGPAAGANAPRILILRPGMRVCAHDVLLDQSFSKYFPGATQCARLVDTPDGPQFDSVASRFAVPLSGSTWSPDVRFRRVTTWAEVQQPFTAKGARPGYILFYTASLKAPTATEEPRTLPLLLAVDLTGPMLQAETASTLDRIVSASKAGDADSLCADPEEGETALPIVCIQFGERATFSADFSVRLNGAAIDLPVAATLGTAMAMAAPDLLARDIPGPADVTRAGDPSAEARLRRTAKKLELRRWFDGRRVRVEMDPAIAHLMPLQPGDEIRW